jgi:hypothetical protein
VPLGHLLDRSFINVQPGFQAKKLDAAGLAAHVDCAHIRDWALWFGKFLLANVY